MEIDESHSLNSKINLSQLKKQSKTKNEPKQSFPNSALPASINIYLLFSPHPQISEMWPLTNDNSLYSLSR